MTVSHSDTNDITNKFNMMQKITKVINSTKENHVKNEIEIVLSSNQHG